MDRNEQRQLPFEPRASFQTAARTANTAANDAIFPKRHPVSQRTANTAATVLTDHEVLLRELMLVLNASAASRWQAPDPPRRLSAATWLSLVNTALLAVTTTPSPSGPDKENAWRRETAARLTVAASAVSNARRACDRAWQGLSTLRDWHTNRGSSGSPRRTGQSRTLPPTSAPPVAPTRPVPTLQTAARPVQPSRARPTAPPASGPRTPLAFLAQASTLPPAELRAARRWLADARLALERHLSTDPYRRRMQAAGRKRNEVAPERVAINPEHRIRPSDPQRARKSNRLK